MRKIIFLILIFCISGCATPESIRINDYKQLNELYYTSKISKEIYDLLSEQIERQYNINKLNQLIAQQQIANISDTFIQAGQSPQKTYIYPRDQLGGKYGPNTLVVEEE